MNPSNEVLNLGSATPEMRYLSFIIKKRRVIDDVVVRKLRRYYDKLYTLELRIIRELLRTKRPRVSKALFPSD